MKDKQRTMNNKQRTYKAFTLLELAVAVALLAMMMLFASLIFNMSIDTYRMAMANAEIMQKLQAITSQLNADFKGVIITSPGEVLFSVGEDVDGRRVRSDCIAFLANGDFQSTRQYYYKTVVGNVASIFYGQAADGEPTILPNIDPNYGDPKEKILLRRQTILTSDSDLIDPCSPKGKGEYFKFSLSQWDVNPPFPYINGWTARPVVNPNNLGGDAVMYMAKGVDDFTIQFAQWNDSEKKFEWVPKKDESEFDEYKVISTSAFKFTFTLYDSKGILKNGKTFTHIVCLGE